MGVYCVATKAAICLCVWGGECHRGSGLLLFINSRFHKIILLMSILLHPVTK